MVIGKKHFLAHILYYSGLFNIMNFRENKRLIVINYHRIRPDIEEQATLFDDGVFGPNEQEFEDQIYWLRRNMDVISEDDLLDFIAEKITPPEKGVLITFDDGYRDNYTRAFPILRRHHLPAIFFIPTLPIEERALGWWDHIAYLLKNTRRETVPFQGGFLTPGTNIRQAIHLVFTSIKMELHNTEDILQELALGCEVELPGPEIQGMELMTWEHIRLVSENNISIGAHTHTHRILHSLTPEQQREELLQSKRIIEEKVGKKVRSLSYPVGHYHHFSTDTKKLAVECGYKMAFSFLTGVNSWNIKDPMDVKRISASNYLPCFVGGMTIPELFCDLLHYPENE